MTISVSDKSDWRNWINQRAESPDALAEEILALVRKEAEARELSDPMRISSAGKCARQMAYQRINAEARKDGKANIYDPEPLNPRALLTFQMGDMVEAALKEWLRKAGSLFLPTGMKPEDAVFVQVDSILIQGHPDGIYQEADGALSVVDFKSIGERGFERVNREGPEYGYVCQVTGYMKALGLHHGRILYYNKGTSHLDSWRFDFSRDLWSEIENRYKKVAAATPDNLPEPEYRPVEETAYVRGTKQLGLSLAGQKDPEGFTILERKQSGYWRSTGRRILEYPCSYCSFKGPCYGRLIQEMDGDKPVWIVPKQETAA